MLYILHYGRQEPKLSRSCIRTRETNESRIHNRAMRSGIGLDCNVAYREIPICSGYDDEGNPIVELVEWPFVLPHQLVTGQFFTMYFCINFHINGFSRYVVVISIELTSPDISQKKSGSSNDSERLPERAGAIGQDGRLLASHVEGVS